MHDLRTWLPLRRGHPDPAMRLFCLPYAGGSALVYRRWIGLLPQAVEVLPIELPGRWSRIQEPAHVRVASLAEEMVCGLAPLLDRPYVLFGHSMGALLAYEMARRLDAQGLGPRQLIVSARRAPHLPDPTPRIYHLPVPEFMQELKRLNGTPEEALVNSELMELMLPLLRADFELCQTYEFTPGPPLSCGITALAGSRDANVPIAHVDAWAAYSSGQFRRHVVEGDHFFLNSALDRVLALVQADLDRQLAAARPS